jgi:hypothetical protein
LDQISKYIKIRKHALKVLILFSKTYLLGVTLKITQNYTFLFKKKLNENC